MAKRKRLSPPRTDYLDTAPPEGGLETKGMFLDAPVGVVPGLAPRAPAPIADMAGAASATAALQEVSAELQNARDEGRIILSLPLDKINGSHLIRDRLSVTDDEMEALKTSLKARGQQTPIEVVEAAEGHYGLISGWRRLMALRALQAETGDPRFATVRALVRHPQGAQDAYVAMVEENEIRVGLSYFERANVVLATVRAGVYADAQAALQALFASASRAKRSKIKSFLPVVETLGAHLRFPAALTERVGLDLARRLEDAGFARRLKDRLRKASPATSEDELALLARALKEAAESPAPSSAALPPGPQPSAPASPVRASPEDRTEIAPGLHLSEAKGRLILSGPAVTPELAARLRAFLQDA